MYRFLFNKKISCHVSFATGTKENTSTKKAKKPSGMRKQDHDYFQTCITEGKKHSNNGEYPQALQQFTMIINAAGASHTLKAETYKQRSQVYKEIGNLAKANHDLEFSLQLNNTGLK